MTRAFASALAVGTIALGSAAAATSLPHLNSAVSHRRHVVVTFTLGDLAPGHIVVASHPKTQPNGAFVKANVVLDEPLKATKTAHGFRARTAHRLAKRRYWVEVSGVVVGVDCTPHKPCRTDWSNSRRVTVK
ncbi:MAG: hypothetical protein ACXVZ3_14910 [Gaiellaceae bacterium]